MSTSSRRSFLPIEEPSGGGVSEKRLQRTDRDDMLTKHSGKSSYLVQAELPDEVGDAGRLGPLRRAGRGRRRHPQADAPAAGEDRVPRRR